MIAKNVMVLQNHTNSAMEVQKPCGELNPTSLGASQVINIKVEGACPVPITFPKIKTEPEVRCMSLHVHCKK
jgi:hypothetical protein